LHIFFCLLSKITCRKINFLWWWCWCCDLFLSRIFISYIYIAAYLCY